MGENLDEIYFIVANSPLKDYLPNKQMLLRKIKNDNFILMMLHFLI